MRSRKRVLVLGEVLCASGYATVLESLLARLAEHYDFHIFARGYSGPPRSGRWTVHPNSVYGDVWGIEQVPELLERLRPDFVWVIYDAVLYLVHQDALRDHPTVLYCPIDGPNPEPETIRRLAPLARLVLFNETARRAVAAVPDGPSRLAVIPHGVDTAVFRPLADRAAVRRRWFGTAAGFVVLNANRNNRRKRPDLTLEGFAAFARERSDALLCMHMNPVEDLDLRALAKDLAIEDWVLWSDQGLSPDSLNELYNACDIGLNTSAGEGWGLVSFEHAATGAAQIVPRHSACAELWADAGVFLEPIARSRAPMGLCEFEDVTAEGVTSALTRLYEDSSWREDRSRAAFAIATEQRYSWGAIATQWRTAFETISSH